MSHPNTPNTINTFLVSTTAALFLIGKGFEPLSVTADLRPLFRFSDDARDAYEAFHEAKFRLNRFLSRAQEQRSQGGASS